MECVYLIIIISWIYKMECVYLIIIINDHIIRVGISNRISASNLTVSTAGISVLAFSEKG